MRKIRLVALTIIGVLLFSILSVAVTAYVSGDNYWLQRASMPQARSDLGMAVVDGKIYAIGGQTLAYQDSTRTESLDLGTNEAYDPASDSWTEKSPMPIPGSDFATVVCEGKIYCIGGGVTDVFNNSKGTWETKQTTGFNLVYDPATDRWNNRTIPPAPERNAVAHLVNGIIYLVNGYPDYSLIQVYDPVSDNWTQSLSAPVTASGASAAIGNKIYFFSGSETHILDTDTYTWSIGAAPNVTFYKGYAVATVGLNAPIRIYVFCNPYYASNSSVYVTQTYNPENNSWQTGESMPFQRMGFGLGVANDTFYLVGGSILLCPSIVSIPQNYRVTYFATNEQYYPYGYGTLLPTVSTIATKESLFTGTSILVVIALASAIIILVIVVLPFFKKKQK